MNRHVASFSDDLALLEAIAAFRFLSFSIWRRSGHNLNPETCRVFRYLSSFCGRRALDEWVGPSAIAAGLFEVG
jgi:hypothetical protein